MNIRDSRIIKWLAASVIAMGTAWAGWVTKNISALHDGQSTVQAAIAEINGKLDVIIAVVKHAGK